MALQYCPLLPGIILQRAAAFNLLHTFLIAKMFPLRYGGHTWELYDILHIIMDETLKHLLYNYTYFIKSEHFYFE